MKLRNKNTGEILDSEYQMCIRVSTNEEEKYIYADSIAELNENWEDYTPKEPLIKDPKIRKAVRAWAEASDVGVARVDPFAVFDIETSARIFFYSRVIDFLDKDYDDGKSYTIAELCGEEEECES